jgi:hypothetical protein
VALLSPMVASRAGVLHALTAAAGGGDTFANGGAQVLIVDNADATSKTVTLNFPSGTTVDGQSVTPRTVTVAAGARKYIGPFPPTTYNDSTSGLVSVSYSAVTSVTVGVLSLS